MGKEVFEKRKDAPSLGEQLNLAKGERYLDPGVDQRKLQQSSNLQHSGEMKGC